MKSQIQGLQRKIYENTRKRAFSFFGPPSPLMKKYQRDQNRYAKRPFHQVKVSELISSINNSRIIYLGDFHTFDQNSRNLERIIKEVLTKEKELFLCLEMVYGDHQVFIDAYLNNDLTELEFLESINYSESWRFPWNHYKVLFDLAKEKNYRIIALNSHGQLNERDQYASNILADLIKQNPKSKILVLFGELHIVPNKIPKEVQRKAKALDIHRLNYTIVHQNLDQVFWKEDKSNHKERIIKFRDNEFSIQSSPPWIKYESLIYWFENLCDDPDFDIHEYLIETGVKTFSSNVHSNFLYLCNEIFRFINLARPPSKGDIEDFNLYDHTKLKLVFQKINLLNNITLQNFYTHLLTSGQSFRLPYSNEYYCGGYSFNRLSYLVGNHIFYLICKLKEVDIEGTILGKDTAQRFLMLLQSSMIAYFSSKIINPHRKCDLYLDLVMKLENRQIPRETRNHIKKGLLVLDTKVPLNEILSYSKLKALHEISKIVGHFLAELIYEKIVIKKYNKSYFFIMDFLFNPGQQGIEFHSLKGRILSTCDYKKTKKRVF